MADRHARIDIYVGPKQMIRREQLPEYDNGEWVGEIKEDGNWACATLEDGTLAGIISRTGLPQGAPELVGKRIASKGTGKLIGELVADVVEGESEDETERTGTRRLRLFEPLIWNRLDLRDLKLEERREALVMIFNSIDVPMVGGQPTIGLVERRESGFLEWYDQIITGKSKVIGKRPEGLVLKKRGSIARAVNADGKVDFWVRCKPKSTVDYIVIGPDGLAPKGTPKIALGLYKLTKDGRRVVKVMSLTWRPKFKHLKAGDVVEVEGAEVFPSGAVRHGDIKRERPDKRAVDCTYEAAVAS